MSFSMAHVESNPDQPDAIDESEISGTAVPAGRDESHNAFTELMALKKSRSAVSKSSQHHAASPSQPFTGRMGLGAYISEPTHFPPNRVVYHNDSFVVIYDLYPKSSIHTLLLPRDPSKILLHPFEALSDPTFLAAVQAETISLRKLVASELRRRYGKYSAQDRARNEVLETRAGDVPEELLPPGRNWDREILSGVHASPSMKHLHIHVLSRDRMSECMRHRKHYNSFATEFLVPINDFPLAKEDKRRHPGHEGFLERDLICWRCGKNYGNRFKALKEHLEKEFTEWKRE